MFYFLEALNAFGEQIKIIVLDNGAQVPKDEMNTDYQRYLMWVDAGNTATKWFPDGN